MTDQTDKDVERVARDRIAEMLLAYRLEQNGLTAAETADAIIAALPDMVVPLEWEDFGGRGAKAKAWGKANYLITRWSDGRFDLVESYPGYQGDNLAGGFLPTLEAAKAAANNHHRAQIMAAFGVTL